MANSIRLPAEWGRKALFPAAPNGRPVLFDAVDVNGRPMQIELGGVDKLSAHDKGSDTCPSVSIDHAIMLMVYLRAYQTRPDLTVDTFSPTFTWFWYEFSGSEHWANATQRKWFKEIQRDLDVMRFRVLRDGRPSEVHNLLESSTEHAGLKNAKTLEGSRFRDMKLHPLFMQAVYFAPVTHEIRFDVLRRLQRPVARALYLWLPAMAYHNTAARPFTMLSETLAEKLKLPPMALSSRLRYLGLRKGVDATPYSELDGLPMRDGNVLRVRFEPSNGNYKLSAWAEGPDGGPVNGSSSREPSGSLYQAYLDGGGLADAFAEKVQNPPALHDDEERLLRAAFGEVRGRCIASQEIDRTVRGNKMFFRQAKTLLHPDVVFDIIAEGKTFAESGAAVVSSLDARLRTIILNEIAGKTKTALRAANR
jgi:hypothetical protein